MNAPQLRKAAQSRETEDRECRQRHSVRGLLGMGVRELEAEVLSGGAGSEEVS